jgi:alkaline phosphatase isozyme conversion protein
MRKTCPKPIVRIVFVLVLLLACNLAQAVWVYPPATPVGAGLRPAPTPAPTPAPASVAGLDFGALARQHLEALSVEIGPRVAGSAAEAEAADYIQATLENTGYTVERMPFTFEDEDGEWTSANLIAIKPGISPVELIVGAHYDSVETGRGADDNASGVGVLLEAAQRIWQVDTPYTIRFIAFGAEEVDLNGSRSYVNRMPPAEIDNTWAMINLDSLVAGDYTYIYGDAGPGTLRDWILDLAQADGIDLRGKTAAELDGADGAPCDCSDYSSFQKVGIPFVYFEATNWEVGDKDGWTQVDPSAIPGGDGPADGVIWHTRFDTLPELEQLFQGRIDAHLQMYVTLLVNTLTQFGE